MSSFLSTLKRHPCFSICLDLCPIIIGFGSTYTSWFGLSSSSVSPYNNPLTLLVIVPLKLLHMPDAAPKHAGQALLEPVIPSLQIGAATGICGFLVGGGVGILRSAHPSIVAVFTGTQFFVLGGSFLYTREALLKTVFVERTRRADLISSTSAGILSGAAAGAFYGRVSSVTGAVVAGTISHLGQRYVHARASSEPRERDRRPLLDRLASSKWIPFKSISNSEYESMLTEKLLKVDAEIAMIDEKIIALNSEMKSSNTNQAQK